MASWLTTKDCKQKHKNDKIENEERKSRIFEKSFKE